MRLFAICLAVLAGQSVTTLAEVVTECGASERHAFFFEGGLVPKGKGGWERDKISDGRMTLNVRDGKPEILTRDASGLRDLKGEGAEFYWGGNNKDAGILIVLSSAAGSIEHYAFRLDTRGNGEVVWGTIRYGSGGTPYTILKSSLMRAPCETPQR